MKWFHYVIMFLVLTIILMIAYFTSFFQSLAWYWWVIISLIAVIIGMVVCFLQASAKVFEFGIKTVVAPWLVGNFGKREK